MSEQNNDAAEVLRGIWQATPADRLALAPDLHRLWHRRVRQPQNQRQLL